MRQKCKIEFKTGEIYINDKLVLWDVYQMFHWTNQEIEIEGFGRQNILTSISIPFNNILKLKAWCARKAEIFSDTIKLHFAGERYTIISNEEEFKLCLLYLKNKKKIFNWTYEDDDKNSSGRDYKLKCLLLIFNVI